MKVGVALAIETATRQGVHRDIAWRLAAYGEQVSVHCQESTYQPDLSTQCYHAFNLRKRAALPSSSYFNQCGGGNRRLSVRSTPTGSVVAKTK